MPKGVGVRVPERPLSGILFFIAQGRFPSIPVSADPLLGLQRFNKKELTRGLVLQHLRRAVVVNETEDKTTKTRRHKEEEKGGEPDDARPAAAGVVPSSRPVLNTTSFTAISDLDS